MILAASIRRTAAQRAPQGRVLGPPLTPTRDGENTLQIVLTGTGIRPYREAFGRLRVGGFSDGATGPPWGLA